MHNRDYPREGNQGRGRGRSGFDDNDFDNLRGHREAQGYGRGFEGQGFEGQGFEGKGFEGRGPEGRGGEGFAGNERGRGRNQGGFSSASDRYAAEHDADYENWRRQQMDDIDRDYLMWQEERRKKFAEEFEKWRGERKTKAQAGNDTSKKQ